MNKPLIAALMVADVFLFLGWAVWSALTKQNEVVVEWVGRIGVFVAVLALARAWGNDWELSVPVALVVVGVSPFANIQSQMMQLSLRARAEATSETQDRRDS